MRSFVARCYTWHLHKCALGYDDVQSFFKRIAGSLVGRRVGRRKGGVEEESERWVREVVGTGKRW